MNNQLITIGEAASILGVTTSKPKNQCLTKKEFDELIKNSIYRELKITSSIPANKCLTKEEFNKLFYGSGYYDPATTPYGVYILHINGKVYPKDVWDFKADYGVGVVVKTPNCSFIMSPTTSPNNIIWGPRGTLVSDCTTTIWSSTAITDYSGRENTRAIVLSLQGYLKLLKSLAIENIVTEVCKEVATTSLTKSVENTKLTYALKEKSEEILTDKKIEKTSENDISNIKNNFKEKYKITSDSVLTRVLEEIRIQLKNRINNSFQVTVCSETEEKVPPTKVVFTEKDIDRISDRDIMLLTTSKLEEYSAIYCHNFKFKNGQYGYLAAEGELYEAYLNKAEVGECLYILGNDTLSTYRYDWSSTQQDADHAWIMDWETGYTYLFKDDGGDINGRPFAAFP